MFRKYFRKSGKIFVTLLFICSLTYTLSACIQGECVHKWGEWYQTAEGERHDCRLCDQYETRWDGSVATSFAGGSGTPADPYLISTGAQLAYLASEINGNAGNGDSSTYKKYYELTNSINLGGREWDPIGCYYDSSNFASDDRTFRDYFNGNGYTVSNFQITSLKKEYYRYFGLFGYVKGGQIKNLGIEAFTIDVNSRFDDVYAGGLMGYNYTGKIEKSYATGNVSAASSSDYAYAGGLVGYNCLGTITYTNATGNVSASTSSSQSYYIAYSGGLVGYHESGTISHSYATGNEKATSKQSLANAGGLVGAFEKGTITNCFATGEVSAKSTSFTAYAGGLVGAIQNGTITNCYATGNVSVTNTSSAAYVGGLVGDVEGGGIKNSYATGNVSATSTTSAAYVGGLVGSNWGGTITDNYRYKSQSIAANSFSSSNTLGTECTLEHLNRASFYTQTLGWSADEWDFSNLDFKNGKTPVLRA